MPRVCNTLATTEPADTTIEHSTLALTHLCEESSRKSCVNGVACAGILESFVVDGISFKVVTEGVGRGWR